MWLLNVLTRQLEEFMDDREVIGKYAILSHTWETGEVSFQDVQSEAGRGKPGYRKVDFACQQAVKDGLDYLWADTACIDKKSSAELSEAINSMWRWYYNSNVCYAYLSDLHLQYEDVRSERAFFQLKHCRWWSRGWTLQELIAPLEVKFFDAEWKWATSKVISSQAVSKITGIDEKILWDRDSLDDASIAKRMSFAADRKTTRIEDQAYALLGIFGINMPLLYGEGELAFRRLQQEIIRTWSRMDHSILWHDEAEGLLARSPAQFPARMSDRFQQQFGTNKPDIISWSVPQTETLDLTSRSLRVTLQACAWSNEPGEYDTSASLHEADLVLAVLDCMFSSAEDTRCGLLLRRRTMEYHTRNHGTQSNARHELSYSVYDVARHTFVNSAEASPFERVTLTLALYPYCSRDITEVKMTMRSKHYSVTGQQRADYDDWPSDVPMGEEGRSVDWYGWEIVSREREPARWCIDAYAQTGRLRFGGFASQDARPRLFLRATPCRDIAAAKRPRYEEVPLQRIKYGKTTVLQLGDMQTPLRASANLMFNTGRHVWYLGLKDDDHEEGHASSQLPMPPPPSLPLPRSLQP